MAMTNMVKEKEALRTLFSAMGINRVVFVDDDYAALSFSKIYGQFATLSKKVRQKIAVLKGVRFVDEESVDKHILLDHWEKLDYKNRYELYNALFASAKIKQTDDKETGTPNTDYKLIYPLAEIFTEIFGNEFKGLSYSEWKSSSIGLIKDIPRIKTIFLFDLDLSKDGGTATQGIRLTKDVLTKTKAKRNQAICAIVTHLLDRETAYLKWQEFADRHDMDKTRFVLISKEYLSKDLLGFIHMLKLMILNGPCGDLVNAISLVIGKALSQAQDEIKKIDIYHFDNIVFRSSQREGIWEPDTLIRLFGIYQRDVLREKAGGSTRIQELANQIREVSSIPSRFENPIRDKSWIIQRLELYESGDHINRLHMPIESGDIFQKTSGSKQFILIAQPCDLMVRSDNTSGGERNPNIREAILAEIVQVSRDTAKNEKKTYEEFIKIHGNMSVSRYELPYYDKDTGDSWYVAFKKTHVVKLIILDLCVFQPNGLSKFTVGEACPDHIIPAWRSRHINVHEYVKKEIDRFNELKKTTMPRAELLASGALQASNDKVFVPTIDGTAKGKETLSYNCARIGRLCQSRSNAMLTAYARFMARDAFEHEFGESPDNIL